MRSFGVNVLVAALGIILAATVIGLVTLWPSGEPLDAGGLLRRPDATSARVVAVAEVPCQAPGRTGCRRVTVRLTEGPDEGERVSFTLGLVASDARPNVGDRVFVAARAVPGGADDLGLAVDRYAFLDFDRRLPLLALALLFGALVLVTGRWQGLRSLVGLVGSLAVIVWFVVPAILEGSSPAGVALVGALTVMFLTIPLAHGIGPKTLAACLGTSAALVVTLALAEVFVALAELSGVSSDEAAFLRAASGELSLQGLLLAGITIGALGVLDDLTVSQASTVMALRGANTLLGPRELFRRAIGVGRDHVAATVNTLVLAYAGASLPILLLFSLGGWGFSDAVNSEVVAEQVVATLVGSIGLIAAVPLTTAIAAFLAPRLPAGMLAPGGHGHHH